MTERACNSFSTLVEPNEPVNKWIGCRGKYKPKEDEKDQPQTPFAEFQVEAGRRYRFRVVNAGSLKCPIVLSIDGHQLLLIASDGKPFLSFLVDSFVSFSGERYDFVLEVKTNSSSILWMRAKGLLECQARNIEQLAVVRVRGGKGGEVGNLLQQQLPFPPDFNGWLLAPSTSDAASQISKMTSLAPDDPSLKRTPDKRFFLEFAYRFRNNTHFHDPDLYPVNVVNNISNVLPPSPFLSQPNDIDQSRFCDVKSKGPRCPDDFCECFHRMVVQEGEVVELVVSNANNDLLFTHPIHMHGYSFRVLAEEMTEDLFRDLDNQGLVRRRLHGAPLKDTVPVPDGGVWFLHCHVAFHAEIGMALTFHVNDVDGRLPAVPSDFPRCGIWPSGPSAASERWSCRHSLLDPHLGCPCRRGAVCSHCFVTSADRTPEASAGKKREVCHPLPVRRRMRWL
ncbi:hypothetical protein C0Q70_20824 [Pomacea canaliculata]|uniref:Plastocyanin-like domain-containing protein n=1 Tax=Pomacea canaliculata TaxID=400727 RepID=A0A2T7NAS9_POMCA|nr:hypothetical protein C0Q70_20824 [Pomacea canaliculata]